MARITVVGAGYVGLGTGVCFAEMGHMVCCIDIDIKKIERLQAGQLPIYEPGLKDLCARNVLAGRLRFSAEYEDGLDGAEFVFLAVGTPESTDSQAADLRYLSAAATSIATSLTAPAVIVNKSTSPIGTGQALTILMNERRPDLAPWVLVSNPEFLREGSAVHDCLHPTRIIIGAEDEEAAAGVGALYETLHSPVLITDLNTAEMIKYASNTFLATRISFINEVARICDALGADVRVVARGMGLDPRIGPAFLDAGLGYGGSCFPKDVAALTHMAAEAGLHPQLLRDVTEINMSQRQWAVDQLTAELGSLDGAVIGLWGLAFKPNTDDLREAPALDIVRRLHQSGACIRAYDPVAAEAAARQGVPATLCASSYEAATGADALLLATEWPEFLSIDWRRAASMMRGSLVFDGRNCLDAAAVRAAGLNYRGVGRSSPMPAPSLRTAALDRAS